MIENFQNRMYSARFGIIRSIDKPAYPGVDHGSGTHGAGLEGHKKFAPREPIVVQRAGGFAECNDLGMRRWICIADNPILSPADHHAIFDDDGPHGNLAGRSCGARLIQSQRKQFSVGHALIRAESSTCRLLLAHAVQRSQSPDQIAGVNADHSTAWK
jgi:hypothetical protein